MQKSEERMNDICRYIEDYQFRYSRTPTLDKIAGAVGTLKSICRNHDRDKWCEFTIEYILNNERYMGDALLQKSFTTESLPFKKVRNAGQQPQYYVENSNPAIVSRETYAVAQELQK